MAPDIFTSPPLKHGRCCGRIRVDRRITGNGKRFRVQAEGSRGAGVGMTKLSLSTKRELNYNVVARLNKRS